MRAKLGSHNSFLHLRLAGGTRTLLTSLVAYNGHIATKIQGRRAVRRKTHFSITEVDNGHQQSSCAAGLTKSSGMANYFRKIIILVYYISLLVISLIRSINL